MARTTTISIAAIMTCATLGAQEFHRHLPEEHPLIKQALPSPDGGMYILVEDVVAKLDADGALEWSKTFGPTNHIGRASDGGIWLTHLWNSSPGEEPFTYDFELAVRKVDAEGDEILAYSVRLENMWEDYLASIRAEVHPMADGGILISSWPFSTGNSTLLIRVHGDGTPGFMTVRLADSAYDTNDKDHFYELEDGSTVWMRKWGSTPDAYWVIDRIGPDGEDISRYMIRKTAPAHLVNDYSYLLDSNNDLVLAYSAFSINPQARWLAASKWDLEGNMLWNRVYRNFSWSIDLAPVHSCERNNGNYRLGGLNYVELDNDGALVFETSCSTPTYTDEYIIDEHRFEQVLLPNDEFIYQGSRRWTDALFGFNVSMPLFGRAHIEQEASCLWHCEPPEPYEEIPVPEPLFELLPGLGILDVLPNVTFTVEPLAPAGGTDVVLAGLGDACELPEIVEAGMGMAAHTGRPAALKVYPSPVLQGGTLHFDLEGARLLRVLDAKGMEVSAHALGQLRAHSLSTAGWQPGMYLLQAFGDGMVPLALQRVVVQ